MGFKIYLELLREYGLVRTDLSHGCKCIYLAQFLWDFPHCPVDAGRIHAFR